MKPESEKKSPLISIITITYNAEKELPVTMESVAHQTFKDYEHLIIDGASKDNTVTIARKMSDSQTLIVSEPDKGLYDAMNKGLKNARGKYVLFLNAGDSFHDESVLEKYGKAASKDNDIIYGDTIIVDADRKFIAPRHLNAPEKLTFKSFSKGMLICHQAFMVKKKLAPQYNLQYRFSADYDWTVKCIKAGNQDKFINLDCVTIDYLSNGLTDKNKRASLIERFKIMSSNYGFMLTTFNHLNFILRALKRTITVR